MRFILVPHDGIDPPTPTYKVGASPFGLWGFNLAEVMGFEPMWQVSPPTCFPNRVHKPLAHTSNLLFIPFDKINVKRLGL